MSVIENKIYSNLITKLEYSSVVIDVGAYIGSVSKNLCYSSRGNPKNYFLIEACPYNYKELEKTCKSFRLFKLALSDSNGTLKFHIANHEKLIGSSQSNSLFKKFVDSKLWRTNYEVVETPSLTLDSFLSLNNISKVDLIKINCEGGEYKIFSAPTLNFLDKVKYLYIQLHGKCAEFVSPEMNKKKKEIVKLLQTKGFSFIQGDPLHMVGVHSGHLHQLWKNTNFKEN